MEYALTTLGHSLREQLFTLGRWAVAHDIDHRDQSSDPDIHV